MVADAVSTPNGANFPGAVGSSPYGPGFGNPGGILRVVGSYQTEASAPYDLSYIYDGAAAPGETIKTLAYPSTSGAETLFTIAHSTFGNKVVGNYDTRLATGNAFIYDINTGTYTTNNIPGAVSTTAYGIYGNKVAGGYAAIDHGSGLSVEHGYIYDLSTDTYVTYDHPGPGVIATHFEGITGAGRAGEYNLVVNWVTADGVVHPGVLHVDANGNKTWYEIDIPGDVVSSNSAYGEHVVGIYLDGTTTHGYVATMPAGMYNPIRNNTPIVNSTNGATGIATNPGGDDVINNSTILMTGAGGVGVKGETYGVITNTGTIVATGLVGAAVEMHGEYGTLLNSGTLRAPAEADALRTGADSYGTEIVNTGIIDGRIAAAAGADKRFENSGWIGVTGNSVTITDLISGTFVQTSAGTFAVRMTDTGNDALGVTGVARLAGTLQASFQTRNFAASYTLVGATQEITGAFETLTTTGLPALFDATLDYTPTTVTLNLAADLAGLPNITPNQRAVGGAIDGFINTTTNNMLTSLPDSLAPLYDLSADQLPGALTALSGEAYASERSVLIGDSLYARQALLSRMRQGSYQGGGSDTAALAFGGPALAYAPGAPQPAGINALAYATKAPAAALPPAFAGTVWAQAFGGWTNLDGDGNASRVSETIGGVVAGTDVRVDNWLLGAALGYSQSDADVDAVASSSEANSLLLALYAGTSSGPWNLRLGASYAFNQIDADRTIAYPGYSERASADYDGGTTQVFAEVGYGFMFQSVALEPYAGLAWVNLHTDGFTESGSDAGLTTSSSSSGVGYSSLGLRAAAKMELSGGTVLEPHVSLAWQHAFGDTTPTAQFAFIDLPGTNFTVGGVPLAENTALVEAGADWRLNAATSLGLSYLGQFADSATVNAIQANLIWRF